MNDVIFDDEFFKELKKKIKAVLDFFKDYWIVGAVIIVILIILIFFQQIILWFIK